MNAAIKTNPVQYAPRDHADAEKTLSFGTITAAALDAVDLNMTRQRVDDIARSSLRAAAGMAQEDQPRTSDKDAMRLKLLGFVRKAIDPERVFQQLCAGVATRKIDANTALWLAQRIVNQACNLASREYARRKRESGVIAGFDMSKDDAGVWNGLEATNVAEQARDNRETANVFSVCDDPDTVEGTFKEWYESIEIPLSALAGASVTRDGTPMQYGQYSRWIETATGLEQVIETFDDRARFSLELANDRDAGTASNDDAWASFN